MTLSAAPLACYECDNSGVDATGNSATLSNSGGYTTGKVGTHAAISAMYKNSTPGFALPGEILAGDFSIAFWFMRPAANNNHTLELDNGVNKNTTILLKRTGAGGFYKFADINEDYSVVTSVAESTGWHHAVIVYVAGVWTCYLDGALQGTMTFNVDPNTYQANPLLNLATNASGTRGTDQIVAFTTALTADDVAYLYNGGSGLAYSSWEITAPAATSRRKRKLTLLV